MDAKELYNYRVSNPLREVTLTLSESDFRALTLWHVEATNNSVPSDFGTFILYQAKTYLQNKIYEAPEYFQASLMMLVRDKDPFASAAEIETATGFSIKQWKRGIFKNKPSQIAWTYIGLGAPLGWGFFKPGWKK